MDGYAEDNETWSDKVMTTMVTALALVIVVMLVLVLVRSMKAYIEVQRAVSLNAACDGGGFERESPRWRIMFTGDTIRTKNDNGTDNEDDCEYVTKTPHYMYNKAYEIFFTWYGKFDRAITGGGLVVLCLCGLLLTIQMCAFDDFNGWSAYLAKQFAKMEPLAWTPSGGFNDVPHGPSVESNVSALAHGWVPYVNWPNRLFTPFYMFWDGWLWSVLCIFLTALWLVFNLALFALRAIVWAWWAVAHLLKGATMGGIKVFHSKYMWYNFVFLVLLLVCYAIFTRAFIGVNKIDPNKLFASSGLTLMQPNESTCHVDPFTTAPYDDVELLKPAKGAYLTYQAALWDMGREWRNMMSSLWTEYNNGAILQGSVGGKVVGFRDFLKGKTAPDPKGAGALDAAGAGYEWLRRVQLNLQVSDVDFEQEMSVPLQAFLGLLVDDADDGNASLGGRCHANGMAMGYMVYDADFMSEMKGTHAKLYAAMAKVRDLSPEREFSTFFTTEASLAAVFLAIVAYLVLLRWNDTVVYYLLLATLASAGAAAFAFVVLKMLRPVG